MTKNLKYINFFIGVYVLLTPACLSRKHPSIVRPTGIQANFIQPSASVQTSIYWYWMSDNLSKEGVIKDLKAMKSVGINRAFIGNIGYESTPYGKVKLFTDEWWEVLHTALKTATDLDIEIGIFNSPGWSQSGGPWIKPEQSMRYLKSTEVLIKGGKRTSLKLSIPKDDFQDVRVIAYLAPKAYQTSIADYKPSLSSNTKVKNLNELIDGKLNTGLKFHAENMHLDIELSENFVARSLIIYPVRHVMRANAELQMKNGLGYVTLKSFNINRVNDNLNVGFDPYGPVAISIPATTAKSFRLVIKNASADFGIAELKLSSAPVVESFTEKTLAKMFESPLPYWNEYQWKPQPLIEDKALLIDPLTVIDISDKMDAGGQLTWNAPAGDWVIKRYGMLPTGVKNSPASAEGTGLEVDKMSKAHVAGHFDAFMGEIIRRIPPEDRKTWKVVVEDSYETGGQNWTDGFIDKFKTNYGYDPLPYLPVMDGAVVGSAEMSDRFLWDLRRFIADRVAYDYVGGLKEVSNKHGLTTWLENYGHWGFPGEFLQYGGQSDEIGGEFWNEGELGDIENRAASSAAHIYGKIKVSAESFTAGGRAYERIPSMMKQRGDRFFTEGINNTLLHVYIHQPTDTIVPGVNANFGSEFNRHNTWFSYMDLFTSYLKRTNYLLQQGLYVADVAYFIGEDAPKMTGVTDPSLPAGYAFDYINAEVIHSRVKVTDGKLVLPDGLSYHLLVLPKLETMRPELLRKIKEMVAQGANVLGPAPSRSPSLEGYPAADSEVRRLALELWGKVDGVGLKSAKFGKGTVMSGMDMQTALNELKIVGDFNKNTTEPVLYLHRKTADEDIYFVSNQSEKKLSFVPSFNIVGRNPEIWDPVTGKIRSLPQFTERNKLTSVPLKLAPFESTFIVFRKSISSPVSGSVNFPEPVTLGAITTPWMVTFDHEKSRGPSEPVIFDQLIDWSKHENDDIKYYSGTAIYKNVFDVRSPGNDERLFLDLGEIKGMAKVKINGLDVGGVWTHPWRVEITNAVKAGRNQVEIAAVNTWVNRLIGDSRLPLSERKTWSGDNPYRPDSPLQSSGLTGQVRIISLKQP